MAFIQSSITQTVTASITDIGRRYLFDSENGQQIRFDSNGVDLFKPVVFSLYDTDINYNSVNKIESGFIPNIRGESDSSGCLSACINNTRRKNTVLINSSSSFDTPNISFEKTEYSIIEKEGNIVKVRINIGQVVDDGSGKLAVFDVVVINPTNAYFFIYGFSILNGVYRKRFNIPFENSSFVDISFATLPSIRNNNIPKDQFINIVLNLVSVTNSNIQQYSIPSTNVKILSPL